MLAANKETTPNVVDMLLARRFDSLSYDERVRIKHEGRPKPKLDLTPKSGKGHNRSLQVAWYEKVEWLTGSPVTNKMYCWPCLLMKPSQGNIVWSKDGFVDLVNLPFKGTSLHVRD